MSGLKAPLFAFVFGDAFTVLRWRFSFLLAFQIFLSPLFSVALFLMRTPPCASVGPASAFKVVFRAVILSRLVLMCSGAASVLFPGPVFLVLPHVC